MDRKNVNAYARALRKVTRNATPAQVQDAVIWYTNAHEVAQYVAQTLNVSDECGSAIVAAFSPRVHWSRNVTLAVDYAHGKDVKCLGQSKRAADAAFEADMYYDEDPIATLKGPKTNAFARNIAGDWDAVTVDVWHLRACGVTDRDTPTVVQYREITEATRRVAAEKGLAPAVLQALAWVIVRGKAD